MKITPYLLALNGFKPYEGRQECWTITNKSTRTLGMITVTIEPACSKGAWKLNYTGPCVSCDLYVTRFEDLQKFLDVMAANQYDYEDIKPVTVNIPHIYFAGWWARGNWDQENFDEYKYKYKNK